MKSKLPLAVGAVLAFAWTASACDSDIEATATADPPAAAVQTVEPTTELTEAPEDVLVCISSAVADEIEALGGDITPIDGSDLGEAVIPEAKLDEARDLGVKAGDCPNDRDDDFVDDDLEPQMAEEPTEEKVVPGGEMSEGQQTQGLGNLCSEQPEHPACNPENG